MAKRFHDTEIWEQDWYVDLPNKYKLLWNYIKDKCDDCGVWRPNKSAFQTLIGEPVKLDEFLQFINCDGKNRIILLPNGRWFLFDFFKFQYGDKFNPKSNVHKGAFKRLLSNGINPNIVTYLDFGKLKDIDFQSLKEIAYTKGTDRLSVAYGNPINRVKDKEQDQGQYKDNCIIDIIPIEKEKKIEREPIGSERTMDAARKAWDDQKWREQTCMGNNIGEVDLRKWMSNYNASIMNDYVDDFNEHRYKKMFRGWLQVQVSKGYNVAPNQKVDNLKKL